ncbi:MAG: hypothetical protein IJ682_11380 [Lachnospiraceae bacterium]|nr:hypothetical protein [Lachnospiraceae bacterium]
MLTLLFIILLCTTTWKLFGFALKASWRILKIVLAILFLPLAVIGLAYIGLFFVAIPFLILVGLVTVIGDFL